jgi:DNA modification methylase
VERKEWRKALQILPRHQREETQIEGARTVKPYYDHGGIVIYHGDCREILPGLKADLCVTDPPYGVRSDVEWDDMTPQEFNLFCFEWVSLARRRCAEMFAFYSANTAFVDICKLVFERVRPLIWEKPLGSQYSGSSEKGFFYTYEPIAHCYQEPQGLVESKSLAVADLIRTARENRGISRSAVDIALRGKKTGLCFRWEEAACLPNEEQASKLAGLLGMNGELADALEQAYLDRDMTLASMRESAAIRRDVLSFRTETGREHPCEKPLGLLTELIGSSQFGSVLDPFSGSGTALVAAKKLGKSAIGIEIEEKYCEIAAKRLSQEVFDFSEVKT